MNYDPLTLRATLSAVFVVLIGLGLSLVGLPLSPGFLIAVILLSGLYLTVLLVGGDYVERFESLGVRVAYFAICLALVGGLFFLYGSRGQFSMVWLSLMPLIGMGRMLAPPWGTAAVVLTSLGLVAAHGVMVSGSWREVPGVLLGVSSAMFFVLVFTDVAVMESEAREESERLSEELRQANEKLAAYAVEAEELAAARERARLAREIHDSLGHYLTVVNVQLEASQAVFEQDPETAKQAIAKARQLTREGLAEIRRSVASLRASPLEGRSLQGALGELVEGAGAADKAELVILGEPRRLSPQAELTLFRTAQEGLTNVRKHAQASHSDLVLDYQGQEQVRLEVRDDGVGSEDPSGGFGLLGVRERIRQLEGRFAIQSRPGRGLTLTVEVPG